MNEWTEQPIKTTTNPPNSQLAKQTTQKPIESQSAYSVNHQATKQPSHNHQTNQPPNQSITKPIKPPQYYPSIQSTIQPSSHPINQPSTQAINHPSYQPPSQATTSVTELRSLETEVFFLMRVFSKPSNFTRMASILETMLPVVGWWLSGWLSEGLSGWFSGWLDGWLDGWLSGWLDGWLSGWLDE